MKLLSLLFFYLFLLTTTYASNSYILITGINYYAEYDAVEGATDSASQTAREFKKLYKETSSVSIMSDLDDGTEMFPTRKNIVNNLIRLASLCKKDDLALFIHYGTVQAINGELFLIPADAKQDEINTLISLQEISTITANSKGKISLLLFSSTFTPSHKEAFSNTAKPLPVALFPFSKNSHQDFIDGIQGGADLIRKGNFNSEIEFTELVNFLSKKASNFVTNKQDSEPPHNLPSLTKSSTLFNAFTELNTHKEACSKLPFEGLLEKRRDLYDKEYETVRQKLSDGIFSGTAESIYSLQAKYIQLNKNGTIINDTTELMNKCESYEKLLKESDVTKFFPKEFTSLIVLKKQARSFYKAALYQKALPLLQTLSTRYQKLTYDTLITHYTKRLPRKMRELFNSVGASTWKSITGNLEKARVEYRKKNYDQAISLVKEGLANVEKAKNETFTTITDNITTYSTPEDYKTALIFIEMLSKIEGQELEAKEMRSELLNNTRFDLTSTYTSKTGITFKYIPAGTFTMGSPPHEKSRDQDEAQHSVTLSKGFFISTTEVTQEQWESGLKGTAVKKASKKGAFPKTNISWYDAIRFCNTLSQREKVIFRLPTEAEWEYACRAGTTTVYNTNTNNLTTDQAAIYDDLADTNSLRPVAQSEPNLWGLYDMHGNVWEWCSDWKTSYSSKNTLSKKPSLRKGDSATKVIRGGSWYDGPEFARSANRYDSLPHNSSAHTGLRIILIAESIK